MIGGVELVYAGARFVYGGGAIDYHSRSKTHFWRHRLAVNDFSVYCPMCANDDKPNLPDLMLRNELALYAAERAVFLLDGTFTVGTPVEIYMRMTHRRASTVCIIHPGDSPGAFVQTWALNGATVVQSVEEAVQWLG